MSELNVVDNVILEMSSSVSNFGFFMDFNYSFYSLMKLFFFFFFYEGHFKPKNYGKRSPGNPLRRFFSLLWTFFDLFLLNLEWTCHLLVSFSFSSFFLTSTKFTAIADQKETREPIISKKTFCHAFCDWRFHVSNIFLQNF